MFKLEDLDLTIGTEEDANKIKRRIAELEEQYKETVKAQNTEEENQLNANGRFIFTLSEDGLLYTVRDTVTDKISTICKSDAKDLVNVLIDLFC